MLFLRASTLKTESSPKAPSTLIPVLGLGYQHTNFGEIHSVFGINYIRDINRKTSGRVLEIKQILSFFFFCHTLQHAGS